MSAEPTTSTEARELAKDRVHWLETLQKRAPLFEEQKDQLGIARALLAVLDENERVSLALLRFDLDCMHLHEQAMSDPFGCEAFVQNRIREIITGAKT